MDTLVQDLLGIVDERDKVERKKMSIASKRSNSLVAIHTEQLLLAIMIGHTSKEVVELSLHPVH